MNFLLGKVFGLVFVTRIEAWLIDSHIARIIFECHTFDKGHSLKNNNIIYCNFIIKIE